MTLRMKRAWLWVAITALGVILAGGKQSQAAGIVVKIGQRQGGGDPPYDYIMQVYLDPGYGVKYDNLFTVENLIGITPASLTSEPVNIPAGVSWAPVISETQTTYPYASDVTWYFTGSTPYDNTGTGEIYLGQFTVETTVNFSAPPYKDGTLISYDWSIVTSDGSPASGSSQTPIYTLAVPEPTSALLLLCGVGIVPFVARYQRRRNCSL
jgi:hypothetical protein